jgi:hypothetical protein
MIHPAKPTPTIDVPFLEELLGSRVVIGGFGLNIDRRRWRLSSVDVAARIFAGLSQTTKSTVCVISSRRQMPWLNARRPDEAEATKRASAFSAGA